MPRPDSDYVDVAERIIEFRDKYPNGRLRPVNPARPYTIEVVDGQTFVVYVAAAYRDPDDKLPGIGSAWEPFPGPTPFTRDSELQNAETSAWGRAMVAALIADTKRGIASRDEIDARRDSPGVGQRRATDAQRRTLDHEIERRGLPDGCPWPIPDEMTMREASEWIDAVKAMPLPPRPERRSTLREPSDESGPVERRASPAGPDVGRLPRAGDDVPPWRRRQFPGVGAPASQIAAWWSVAYAAAPGIAHKRFLAAAQDFARQLERPVPLATGDVVDPMLVDVLFDWLDERLAAQPALIP